MHKITEKQRNNLLEAARLIEANPEHFDMGDWVCGTTACVAGWAIMANRSRKSVAWTTKWWAKLNADQKDAEIERATGSERVFSSTKPHNLFYNSGWFDCEASRAYDAAQTPEERAKAAADYVRWFVENHTEVEKSK